MTLITTGKKPPPTFELELPEVFDIKPDYTVELPGKNQALVFAYRWADDGEQSGFRIEWVGPQFNNTQPKPMSNKLRYPYEVNHQIVAMANKLLRGQAERIACGNDDDEDEDEDDRRRPKLAR